MYVGFWLQIDYLRIYILQKSIKKALFSPNPQKVIKNSLSDISARGM